MLDPLVILLLGIVTVIGLIIVLRVNAFVALITAAILVSLLSPGPMAAKIARVADAFGGTAAKIGVVIALAAVIGKCLMDSGAADRIVRGFQRLLGEKRSSVALLSSGFVLSMPVFFDTVFYLLVPLARSLWRRTRKNYVLYVTAISAGAAITHTLVPPTPGPLVMAENLRIDLGTMIVMGTLIGLPMAAFGLVICGLMNRWMPIDMRPYSGESEPEPLPDDKLPALWISLLPVLLPVLLISANTFTQMVAANRQAALLRQGEGLDWPQLAAVLARAETAQAPRAARPFCLLLPEALQNELRTADPNNLPAALADQLRAALNELVHRPHLCQEQAFAGLTLPEGARRVRDMGFERLDDRERGLDPLAQEQAAMSKLSQEEVERFNWLLLQAAFPGQVHRTPYDHAAGITAILGDANLALLLSAVVAMILLLRMRGLSLPELAKTTEVALMSAGVIILITAGGGAFGAMLREAGVKDSVEQLVQRDSQNVGAMMLVMGFVLASVMKVAQGSGTVSMITTSAIMASMGASAEMLQCHPVYLAATIGCGSVCGSWMNDSGFWIYARMGGFTEVESLKTWTILLVLIGVFGLGVTMVLSQLFPMV